MYAKCPYYVVLYMQSVLIIYCFKCILRIIHCFLCESLQATQLPKFEIGKYFKLCKAAGCVSTAGTNAPVHKSETTDDLSEFDCGLIK